MTPASKFQFVQAMNTMIQAAHQNSVDHGFWDASQDQCDGSKIALMHSELGEMTEGLRQGSPADSHCPEFPNPLIELADLFIRGMDLAGSKGWPLAEAILAKHEFNKSRPHKHGKNF